MCDLGAIRFNLGSRGLILVTFGVDFGAFGVHFTQLRVILEHFLGLYEQLFHRLDHKKLQGSDQVSFFSKWWGQGGPEKCDF